MCAEGVLFQSSAPTGGSQIGLYGPTPLKSKDCRRGNPSKLTGFRSGRGSWHGYLSFCISYTEYVYLGSLNWQNLSFVGSKSYFPQSSDFLPFSDIASILMTMITMQ